MIRPPWREIIARPNMSALTRGNFGLLLRRHAEEAAGIGVLEHPHRAVRTNFHVANAWPTLQRSAGVAPPLPSKVMRLSVCVAIPLIRAEPRHCGNIVPL